MTYYLIYKPTVTALKFHSASNVAIYLLGRKWSDFIIIKEDDNGQRLYNSTTGDIAVIEHELEVY